jgi:hypothetical protein
MLLDLVSKYRVSFSGYLRFLNFGAFSSGHPSLSPNTLSSRAFIHRLYELKVYGVQLFEPIRDYLIMVSEEFLVETRRIIQLKGE